ncbi:MAG: phosphoglycerate dehydrogenase [Deltaproteobacteria bacterium]|nr:phosphoglycerate dehydrogenase [Deltaproteobacteria bacterium]
MKVLISDKLSEEGLNILKQCSEIQFEVHAGLAPEELRKIIGNYEALIIRSGTTVDEALIAAADNLKIIGRAGIGVDNVDLNAASKKGIIVENTPSGNAVTTAEHAIAMLFSVSRMIPQASMSMKQGKWEKKKFMGRELCNKNLGIVGVGNIGKIVADRALGLKMKVLGYDPFLSSEAASKLGIELVDLDTLFKKADYITVHVPLNDKTKNLINQAAFEKMKSGVFIVNCARGGIVNEKDLLAALESGKVGGAALDVFEQEPPAEDDALVNHPQVVCTPHLGASTDEAQVNVAIEVAEQVVDYLTKGEIRNAVNFPSISAELAKILKPFFELCEKVGSLQGHFLESSPKVIKIEYSGDLTNYPLAPLTTCVLKGILETVLSDVGVNFVNSPVLAKERGIKVIESKVSESENFTSLVKVSVETDKGVQSISGTMFGINNPRIVKVNDFFLEFVPQGHTLLIRNLNTPGVIGNIGSLLGENKINISRMQLGLSHGSEEALSFYNVDSQVGDEVLKKIKALPNIISVKEFKL